MKLHFALLSVFVLVLSGCNATSNTSFRDRTLAGDRDTAIFIDAKQRAVLSRVHQEVGENKPKIRRFCSEPSPDFVSVMAQSLAAGGSFGQSADPKSVEIMAQLAYSNAENGTTLVRTQTINMLRELMFRTCERFLSAGYDEMELSIQAVRDQRLMVSILAIEQLTGVVLPSPVVVNASGSASAGLGEEAIKTFAKLRDEKQAAETAQKTAQDAYDKEWKAKADDTDKPCDTNKAAYAAADTEEKKKPLQEKKDECDGLKGDLDAAKVKTKEATEAYDIVKKAMETGGVSAQTVTDAIANGGLSRPTTQATARVAGTVERIVELNFQDDTEVMLFCLGALNRLAKSELDQKSKDRLSEQCLSYLEKDIELAEAKKVEQIAASNRQINKAADDLFPRFWQQYSARLNTPADKATFIANLRSLAGNALADCFDAVSSKPDYQACFEDARDPAVWRALANGGI